MDLLLAPGGKSRISEKNFFKLYALASICIVFIVLSGCTTHYIPGPYPIKKGAIPDFTSSSPVGVVNALQGNSKQVVIGVADGRKYVGDLYEYTEAAVNLLQVELGEKNVPILSSAKKTLRLEVIKASLFYESFIYKTNIALKVETDKGYIREYNVVNSSGIDDRSIDGAITKAVTSMLNDNNIIDYIKK